jgi:chromosome segregation ATPase
MMVHLRNINEDYSEGRAQLNKCQEDIKKLERRVTSLEDDNTQLKRDNSALKRHNHDLEIKIDNLGYANLELKRKLFDTTSELLTNLQECKTMIKGQYQLISQKLDQKVSVKKSGDRNSI